MFFLQKMCGSDSNIQVIWTIVGYIINIIMIGVPIALIIFGMFDLGKAVIASKEDEVKKATKLLGKRFVYAIGVFAMVWFVTFLFDTLSGLNISGDDTNDDTNRSGSSWQYCWKCNIRGGADYNKCEKAADNLKITNADERNNVKKR